MRTLPSLTSGTYLCSRSVDFLSILPPHLSCCCSIPPSLSSALILCGLKGRTALECASVEITRRGKCTLSALKQDSEVRLPIWIKLLGLPDFSFPHLDSALMYNSTDGPTCGLEHTNELYTTIDLSFRHEVNTDRVTSMESVRT